MEQLKKVVVLGCKGMAGHVIKAYLKSIGEYDVWGIARGIKTGSNLINLDVSNTRQLESILYKNSFDIVVNCIGLLNKTAEDNPELAVWFNSYFPQLLASYGEKYGFKLIHISTDCVFSGKEGSYTEESFKDGIGYYSQTKALGEIVNNKDLTFRTSIIGPELKIDGIGLFHWFMHQMKPISGYTEAYWTGVTTFELAKAIHQAIHQDLTGLYHLVNNSKISKYELLGLFNTIFKNNSIEILADSNYKSDKSLVNSRNDFNYIVPSYKTMIFEMKEWMKLHKVFYQNYTIE